MNHAMAIPAWAAMITAVLLIAGAAITLIGTLGLLRLRTFYERIHAPTLGTTLGTGCIVMASMVYFSAAGSRPILHELLILIFITVTTPITLMILVRAAVSRDKFESGKSVSEEDKRHGREVTT
jgi:multicomponent K+:H+ antiporter subunit G